MLKVKVQQRIVNFVLRLARPTTTFNPKLYLYFSDLQFILPSNKKLDLKIMVESFSNFSCMFLNPNIFSNLSSNCSNSLDLRNLQEQVKKTFCYS